MDADYIKSHLDQILYILYPSLVVLEWTPNDNDFDWFARWETSDSTPQPDLKLLFGALQDVTSDEYKIVYDALEPNYRQKRAAEYIAKLSSEGTFQTSVGDLFDAIISAIVYDDMTELLALVDIIEDIKSKHPKPQK